MKTSLGKNFYMYSLGQMVSSLGDTTAYLSLSWWVLQKTGSGLQFAMLLAPVAAIQIFLQPLLGPLIDRYSRKHIMIIADILRMLTSAAAFLMIYLDHFNLSWLIAIACLGAVFTAMFEASVAGLTRFIVKEEVVSSAFQVSQMVSGFKAFLNPALSGVLVSLLGPGFGTLFNLLTYGIALFCNIQLNLYHQKLISRTNSFCEGVSMWWSDLKNGFLSLAKVHVILGALLLSGLFQFLFSHLAVTLPVMILKEQHLAPWHLGLLEASIGVGAIIGALTARLGHRILPGRALWMASFIAAGLGVLLLGLGLSISSSIVGLILMMVVQTWLNIQFQTKVSLAIPPEYQGRVFSFMGLITTGLLPLGLAFAGGLAEKFSAATVISVSGVVCLALFPVVLLIPRLHDFLSSSHEDVQGFIKKTYPEAFL
ncbi:MAG: MFS transporter [Bacillota bacterium]